jgi:predicted RNase H-like HicB family nuclease
LASRYSLPPRIRRQAIEFHLEGLREDGMRIPAPRSYSAYVDVSA